MISRFRKFVTEELNSDEKKSVDKWTPASAETKSHTDHYFGHGNDVKEHQLAGTADKSEVHKQIERHLGKEIHSDDYKEGLSTDKYGRKVKIGGELAKSKAPADMIHSFANDSTRQGKKFSGLTVKVSRHAHDVAGQTSHNQSWQDQSCKNFNTGSNRHYLKHEVQHGTVVGYLKDHTGKEIARTTLQPHINNKGHHAYAVDSHYGIDHAGFKNHMHQVAKELSGAHKGGSVIYRKHTDVYDDNSEADILHPNLTHEDMHALSIHKDDKMRRLAACNSPHPEHLVKLATDEKREVRSGVAKNPHTSEETLERLHHDGNMIVRSAAYANHNTTTKQLAKGLHDEDRDVRMEVSSHHHMDSKLLHQALDDSDFRVRASAITNPNATKEHYARGLSDSSESVRLVAVRHNHAITHEQLSHALRDELGSVRGAAARHANATSEHLHTALSDADSHVTMAATENGNATKEHLERAMNSHHFYLRGRAASHKNLDPKHLAHMQNDESEVVRRNVLDSPHVTSEHVSKALDDTDNSIKVKAAKHKMATNETLHKALRDSSTTVKIEAIRNEHATREHFDKGMKDKSPIVRSSLAAHPLATEQDRDALSKDKHYTVRVSAIRTRKLSKARLTSMLGDTNPVVKRGARERLNIDHAPDNG